jgi:nucleotide-binding universal stress UspA family protein
MKALEVKQQIALKNILFATDFEASASRALSFAVALAERYGAKFYAAHVIPSGAYALARPESIELTLEELQAHASCALNQIIDPLRQHSQVAGRYWDLETLSPCSWNSHEIIVPTWL